MSGTFVWLAAGGVDNAPVKWATSIRVAAPASAAIDVDYTFYDRNGKKLNLDTTVNLGLSVTSGNELDFSLNANQPEEIELLGSTGDGPNYRTTATGSVYAVFYCPDATTCSNVMPQLLYSALPTYPWSLSVPIAWDDLTWTQWSAAGLDDGGTHRISLVIYNDDVSANTYNVYVYNHAGAIVGSGQTPSIPPLQVLANGSYSNGGTYGVMLSDIVSPLPSGVFKVLIDSGSLYSAVEVLQVNGTSATTLQVAYDSAPSSTTSTAAVRRATARGIRKVPTRKQVFSAALR